ncbi:DUF4913 domain-containing protein [Corynebacterium bovis]|uniref:DUF4913 domain-containing protein n=1 Tax=Corynebacterium bovis TaxID=36808 RepID=A0A3R8QHV4_9CORY|nr:DUF4913 domain-containing protein [Corynebacterium bovis]RRO92748.1 DUF4913 domain-containing protein [Corynebacterium bovis]RRQ00511.1 DUF4913 domain-containing protein [Corynebacterium bovis]RRQ04017.1 DUF4913 domain-containing protein [Corynebacterium bovis]RRQ04586.1 DUF4913 domain-containing protein [Corynebacterium bovis]RRQ13580.1 DUF4913 domain-containing protein [Corynebacterium bovis]
MSRNDGDDKIDDVGDTLEVLDELAEPDIDEDDPATGGDGQEEGVVGRRFSTVVEFVEGFVRFAVNRKMSSTPGQGLRWDPDWHQYPEVVYRLTAVHEAYEEAVAAGGLAVSSWWVHHFDPHMRVILDGETGPFARYAEGAITTTPAPLPVTDPSGSVLL